MMPDSEAHAGSLHVMAYGPTGHVERENPTIAEVREMVGTHDVTWVNVTGLADLKMIEALGKQFSLHRLALEDVVNVHQRPKAEEYGDHLFIAIRMPVARETPETEQVTLFVGPNFLLSFQEQPDDCFDPVRRRIRDNLGVICQNGPDYLAYALLDAIVDEYFPVLERYGERLEDVELAVMADPASGRVGEIHDLKRDFLMIRRSIWPMREMINGLIRSTSATIAPQTQIYLRDCYDHTIQLMDVVETYREIASGLVDIYLSSVSQRTNEIMKVLTIIATIFIPLSFIASLYGMNFNPAASPYNMPELNWYLGYPFALLLMLGTAVGLLFYFHRRRWIGFPRRTTERRENE